MAKRPENTHTMLIRVPEKEYVRILSFIGETGMSCNEFVRRACREKVERDSDARGGNKTEQYVTREELEQRIKQILETQTITQTNSGNGAKQSLKIKK